jgi:Flp pilus assembly protein TadG
MRTITNRQKDSAGQSLVEFALSLMLILIILVGAVEVSLALFEYVTMRDAAQEGALYGSINPADTNGIKKRVIAAASDVLTLTNSNITVTINGLQCEGLTAGTPNSIKVTVSRQHQIIMPIAGSFLGGQQINMSASVTDTILSPACH